MLKLIQKSKIKTNQQIENKRKKKKSSKQASTMHEKTRQRDVKSCL